MDPARRPPDAASSTTTPDVAFLARRVGLFGLVGMGLGAFFLVVRVLLAGDALFTEIASPSFGWHAAAVLSLALVWWLSRAPGRSAAFVQRVEAAGLLASSAAYVAMGATTEPIIRPDHIVVLALTLGFLARAVYVPSPARRTALLGLAIAVPLLPTIYWVYDRWTPPPGYPFGKLVVHTFTFVETAAWWLLAVVLGTATSHVLYGLRREASAARRLGQYTLEEMLGEGGMGMVFRARHAMLRRPTAIKLLPADRAGDEGIARFEREVQLTASLTHPHTVTVYDFGRTQDGVFYYAMELLEGATLAEVVEVSGPQPPSRVVPILEAVAGALGEAHAVGLIHRDVKPANVMLCRHGGVADFPKVLDFGLVKELDPGLGGGVSLTQANTLAGTPLYMAPETILDPHGVDARSDLYALGAVAYFLLTGRHVFEGKTSVEVCSHHLHTPPTPPSARLGAPLPPDLERLVLDCLAKEPGARPASAEALVARLRDLTGIPPWTAADADAWWARHGAALRTRRAERGPSAGPRTLEVDLERRVRGRRAASVFPSA